MRAIDIASGHDAASRVHADLVAAKLIAPLTLQTPDEVSWVDCELASFAEHRLLDRTDPRCLDERHRNLWRARATTDVPWRPSTREYDRCFWLLHDGERVGSVALSAIAGSGLMRLSSLYIYPPYRGRSISSTFLRGVLEACERHDLGVRLSTNWGWSLPISIYLRMGMWVRIWKRDIELRWDTTRPIVEMDETRATISYLVDGEPIVLAEAERRGDRLEFRPSSALGDDRVPEELRWDAPSTLALWIAQAAWPLVRSRSDWDMNRYCDAEAPEGLAQRIVVWEAWDRAHGWHVAAPRIPDLRYATWKELEASWITSSDGSSTDGA